MKVCITSKGDSIENDLDPRFGRAAYFIILNPDTMEYEAVENMAANTGGGAGITSGQFIVDKGIKTLITGNLGPNAASVLKAADVKVYKGVSLSIRENIKKFKEGKLESVDTVVPPHFGMGN